MSFPLNPLFTREFAACHVWWHRRGASPGHLFRRQLGKGYHGHLRLQLEKSWPHTWPNSPVRGDVQHCISTNHSQTYYIYNYTWSNTFIVLNLYSCLNICTRLHPKWRLWPQRTTLHLPPVAVFMAHFLPQKPNRLQTARRKIYHVCQVIYTLYIHYIYIIYIYIHLQICGSKPSRLPNKLLHAHIHPPHTSAPKKTTFFWSRLGEGFSWQGGITQTITQTTP